MLPSKIRVKVLPEAAAYISVSRVGQREFSMAEIRYKWESLDATDEDISELLENLPHAEPSRPFTPARARMLRFRRGFETVEISQATASRKPLFARQSFWDGLLQLLGERVQYLNYSDADRADVFAAPLDAGSSDKVNSLLPLLRPAATADRLRAFQAERIEWVVPR
jgi:hypothetical protein